uniref:Uncharacterized protein n=1 Tax=Cucumis melo TaxID=3656 RepID=A0A9I9EAR5_CUCME
TAARFNDRSFDDNHRVASFIASIGLRPSTVSCLTTTTASRHSSTATQPLPLQSSTSANPSQLEPRSLLSN